jgi:2-polyprenyl-3-methyl-5-hydroxy-6-metoxy-1,4-benzoquinol methylase
VLLNFDGCFFVSLANRLSLLPTIWLGHAGDVRIKLSRGFAITGTEALSLVIYNCRTSRIETKDQSREIRGMNKHSSEQQPESSALSPQVNLGASMPLADATDSFQEVSTQRGYALWAASYDQEKNPLIAVEELHIDKLLASLSFTRALDVGTGTGRYAFKLARRGANVTAIDQSAEMLAVARRTAQNEGLSIDFRLASLEEGLLFGSDRFDLLMWVQRFTVVDKSDFSPTR